MCGLVGIAGNIFEPHKKAFRDMLVFDQVRGFDSTGVAVISGVPKSKSKVHYQVRKEIGGAENLWCYGSDIMNNRGVLDGWPRAMMGHNRAATVGKVTVQNAHPFQYGHIVGAHNGSLYSYQEMAGAKDVDVDSQAVFNNIALHGIDDTWKKLHGAAALSYWDEKDQTLNFIRNEDRPLFFGWGEKLDVLFWASEAWMIQVAAMRNKIKLQTNEEGNPIFTPLKTHKLHSFKMTNASVELVEERDLEKKPKPIYPHTNMVQQNGTGHGGKKTATNNYSPGFKANVKANAANLKQKAKNFKPNPKWKDKAKRCSLDINGVTLRNIRMVSRSGLVDEIVFRLNMYRGNSLLGNVDVHCQNAEEFMTWYQLAESYREGDLSYRYKFLFKPRVCETGFSTNNVRYVCAPSAIEVTRTKRVAPEKKPESVTENFGFMGPDAGLYTKSAFEEYVKRAGGCCSWCSGDLLPEDHKNITWKSHFEAYCPECTTNWGGQLELLFASMGK